jgi:CBS domain-containing protein
VPALLDIELVPASIGRGATFLEAAETLAAHPVSALAVLDDDERVVGVFSGEDLLRGLFPRYLEELHHTAFVRDDSALPGHVARDEPVEAHMHRAVTVEHDASAIHIAEVFLHCDLDALPVERGGKFVGMLGRTEFCQAMLRSTTP